MRAVQKKIPTINASIFHIVWLDTFRTVPIFVANMYNILYLVLLKTIWRKYYYLHFTREEIAANTSEPHAKDTKPNIQDLSLSLHLPAANTRWLFFKLACCPTQFCNRYSASTYSVYIICYNDFKLLIQYIFIKHQIQGYLITPQHKL